MLHINILHNRTVTDVCMRCQRLWFAAAVSAGGVWKQCSGTRNSQINKLRKEEERVERGRQHSPNNKLRGGESLGNIIQSPGKQWNYIYSKQLFHRQHFHRGALVTAPRVLFFHLKTGGSVDTTENRVCFKALKTPAAWMLEAFHI